MQERSTTDNSQKSWSVPIEWQDYLSARAITPEVAAARGYRSVFSGKADGSGDFAADYGFPSRSGGLLIPLHPLSGEQAYQLRLRDADVKVDAKGNRHKFLSPKGQSPVLSTPPGLWNKKDAGQLFHEDVLFIVEGTTRIDALASIGVPSVGIQGVNSWRSKKSGVLPELRDLPLRGKRVAVFPDGDVDTTVGVNGAIHALGEWLYRQGIDVVRVSTLPPDEGLDDWIARMLVEGKSAEDVRNFLPGITQPYEDMKTRRDFAKATAERENEPFLDTAERDWAGDENLAALVMKRYSRDLMIVYSEGKQGVHNHVVYWLGEDGVWSAEPAALRKAISSTCGDSIMGSFARQDAPIKELMKLLLRIRSGAGQLAIIAVMPGTAERLVPDVPRVHRSELNRPSGYVGLRNGVWNLQTLEPVSKEEAREALITSRMPITYEADAASHTAVERMLESYGEGAELMLAHLGRALYRQPGEHFLLIHGDPDSGKSTLLTPLSRMMGDWCQSMMPDALMHSRDNRAHNSNMGALVNTAIAICEEVGGASFGSTLREGAVLKDVTGGLGTHMNFSEKGLPGIDLPVTATIIMSCNSLPSVGLNDTATAKRLRLFHTEHHVKRDETVRQDLLALDGPAERYLFRLMMEHAKENPPGSECTDNYHSRPKWMHDLVNSASVQERTEFEVWARAAIVEDSKITPFGWKQRLQVIEVWAAWCQHNNVTGDPATTKEVNGVRYDRVSKLLRTIGLMPPTVNVKNAAGKSLSGWYGYRLRSADEWPNDDAEYASPERQADTAAEEQAKQDLERERNHQQDARADEEDPEDWLS